jgi:ABC-type sugar transport system ATPase subunit
VETVYQDLAVCPNLGAAINLSLGREPRKGWSSWLGSLALFDRAGSIADATERMAKLGVHLDDYSRPVRNLSGGQRQCVAIARTIADGVRVVILDEPTAALGVRQKSLVLRLARRLADDGAAVVVITHDAEAVELIADHIIVMNLGRVSYDGPAGNVSSRELVHLMAGFPLEDMPTTKSTAPS